MQVATQTIQNLVFIGIHLVQNNTSACIIHNIHCNFWFVGNLQMVIIPKEFQILSM